MTEGMREVHDHGNMCTWHDIKGARCSAPAVIGSAKSCLCRVHEESHRKLVMDPEAFTAWKAARDAD